MHARSLEAVREAFAGIWKHTDDSICDRRDAAQMEGRVVLDEARGPVTTGGSYKDVSASSR